MGYLEYFEISQPEKSNTLMALLVYISIFLTPHLPQRVALCSQGTKSFWICFKPLDVICSSHMKSMGTNKTIYATF